MSATGQLLHGDSWTQNSWLECTIVQNFLSEIFRFLINIQINEGQITNNVKKNYGRNLRAPKEAWRESKGIKRPLPYSLMLYRGFHSKFRDQCLHIALWYFSVRNNTIKEEWERDHEFEWVGRWSGSGKVWQWGW